MVQALAGANGMAAAQLAIGGVPLARSATGFDPVLALSGPAGLTLDGAPPQPVLPVAAEGSGPSSNTGFASASLGAPSVAGADWSVVGTTCGPTLAQGVSCTLTLRAETSADGPLPTAILAFPGAPALAPTATASSFAAVLA